MGLLDIIFGTNKGKCGKNLTWRLDDGTLIISGHGEMENYLSSDYPPWFKTNRISDGSNVSIKKLSSVTASRP